MNPTACDNLAADEYRDSDQEPRYDGKDLLDNINNVIVIVFINVDAADAHTKFTSFLILQIMVDGLTDVINFDEKGQRNAFYVEVLEFQPNNDPNDPYSKIAKYRYPWPDPSKKVELLRDFSTPNGQTEIIMQNKVFKVIMRPVLPFLRKR